MVDNQDWDYKVIHKNNTQKGEKGVNQALQQGKEVESIKKHEHTNKQDLDGKQIHEILNSDKLEVEHVSHDFKIALQQARCAKKINQEQLAKQINERKSVIQDYESGKAIPDMNVIYKLEKALGVQLPKQKKEKKKKSEDQN